MSTLIYAPEVTIRIRTSPNSRGKGQIIDVSEDIVSGSVTRIIGVSTTEFSLLNQGQKYDGMFSPMDTVVVYLRRIKTVLKFSGYLDAVPKWQAQPDSINLRASCTMKRLVNFLWDPTSQQGSALLNGSENMENAVQMADGGAAQRATDLLHQVAKWPKAQIHIARIPENWYDKVSKVADTLIAEAEAAEMAQSLGGGAWLGGVNSLMEAIRGGFTEGIGPGTGYLPANRGRISHFGGPNGGAYGNMALTGESGVNPRDNWYVAMRWPYVDEEAVEGAEEWWRNRKILVVNPKNNKAVVLRAADWGPNVDTGRVIDVSPHALKQGLGASTDDIVHIAFAPDNAGLGPVDTSSATLGSALDSAGAGSPAGASANSRDWGAAGDERNIVSAKGAGIPFRCHRLAKTNFEGFLNDLVAIHGYAPKVVYGYNDRTIKTASGQDTGRMSNHAWGAAIDVDPDKNQFFGSGRGGPHSIPSGIVSTARKWGLGWGGEWQNSKDYMHFEVIGAPASSIYEYNGQQVGPGSANSVVVAKWRPPLRGITKPSARFGQQGPYWANGHSGTDFSATTGTPIYPVGPGTVLNKGTGDSSYGNHITIDHGGQNYTFYAHMAQPSTLAIGTPVSTETVLGPVGETGNVTGAHVHVEYRKGADTYTAALNIEKYILGGAARLDPPSGSQAVEGDYSEISPDLSAADIGKGLFNVHLFNLAQLSEGGTLLGGYRALLNDVPIYGSIKSLMGVAQRDFCSAPNGDFIAWFPDYFGHYGQAGKMVISPLEISGVSGAPTIGWSDENLKTHQYVVGATSKFSGDAELVTRQANTAGVASVEFPELLTALLNISVKEAEEIRDTYLHRYGPRVEVTPMNDISGARQEFFFACHLFQKNWAQQYRASVNLTFMPELYPGMLACFPELGIQGYVIQTVDRFSSSAAPYSLAFETSVSCAPWSSIGKNSKAAADGLPIGAPL